MDNMNFNNIVTCVKRQWNLNISIYESTCYHKCPAQSLMTTYHLFVNYHNLNIVHTLCFKLFSKYTALYSLYSCELITDFLSMSQKTVIVHDLPSRDNQKSLLSLFKPFAVVRMQIYGSHAFVELENQSDIQKLQAFLVTGSIDAFQGIKLQKVSEDFQWDQVKKYDSGLNGGDLETDEIVIDLTQPSPGTLISIRNCEDNLMKKFQPDQIRSNFLSKFNSVSRVLVYKNTLIVEVFDTNEKIRLRQSFESQTKKHFGQDSYIVQSSLQEYECFSNRWIQQQNYTSNNVIVENDFEFSKISETSKINSENFKEIDENKLNLNRYEQELEEKIKDEKNEEILSDELGRKQFLIKLGGKKEVGDIGNNLNIGDTDLIEIGMENEKNIGETTEIYIQGKNQENEQNIEQKKEIHLKEENTKNQQNFEGTSKIEIQQKNDEHCNDNHQNMSQEIHQQQCKEEVKEYSGEGSEDNQEKLNNLPGQIFKQNLKEKQKKLIEQRQKVQKEKMRKEKIEIEFRRSHKEPSLLQSQSFLSSSGSSISAERSKKMSKIYWIILVVAFLLIVGVPRLFV